MTDLSDMRFLSNGDFGEVRWVHFPVNYQEFNVPFQFRHGGWHRCNSNYYYHRVNGDPDHILLFSLTEGGVLKLEDEPEIFLPASSVVWLPANRKHTYYTRPGHIWELYWLHIATAPHLHLDQIFQDKPFLLLSNMEKISSKMEKLLLNKPVSNHSFAIKTSQVCSEIYYILLNENLKKQNDFYSKDTLICSVIQDMSADCSRDWKLEQLSEKYFISVSQLIRRFKSTTGMSPHAYLMSIRLHNVAEYLLYTTFSLDEISRKTGFASSSNMISQFKKSYGITPCKYRENNR